MLAERLEAGYLDAQLVYPTFLTEDSSTWGARSERATPNGSGSASSSAGNQTATMNKVSKPF